MIDEIKNDQFALQTQVERLQSRLVEQYERYRDEVGKNHDNIQAVYMFALCWIIYCTLATKIYMKTHLLLCTGTVCFIYLAMY